MKNGWNNLFQTFRKKGFLPVEIPDLVKDAMRFMGSRQPPTPAAVDQELEDLGWGIGVMDDATYDLMTSLMNSSGDHDAYGRIHKSSLSGMHRR